MIETDVTFSVNGERVRLAVEPRRTLADALREDCGLTGTHLGCEHGVCGACTVIVDGEPARACLMFAVQADGSSVTTVEGLQGTDGELHPLQEAFVVHHGLQCGFCTPGMIMASIDLVNDNPSPSEDEVREGIEGNLCRCTGYQNIVRAVQFAAAELRGGAPAGQDGAAEETVAVQA
jgi:aerobic carbon-monoxide dehydrogenase small subunit